MQMDKNTPSEHCDLVSMISEIEDPRREHGRLHKIEDVLTIGLCTILCGHSEFTEMAFFGEVREDWLRGFLELPNGIPSHDTFRNVFAAIDSRKFLDLFARWTSGVCKSLDGEIVAIDGKALRGTKVDGSDIKTVVGAWAVGAGISLGQVEVDGKSNEITAVPVLLDALDLKGCIVTADAMGCQRNIAEKVVAAKADYVLALKGNQEKLHEQVSMLLDVMIEDGVKPYSTENRGRGRIERRRCWAFGDLDWLEGADKWKGLKSIAAVELERTEKGKTSVERRYSITSLEPDTKKIAHAVRSHWAIENSLHWVLDVGLGEDRSRARERNAAANLSSVRRLAHNLIKKEKKYGEWSVKKRKFAAAQDPNYLLKLLGLESDA
jgi:predicted transposase YbfD/YdcC